MPKSKRSKKISLTQTKKKGLELKQRLVEDIRRCVDQYNHIFMFSLQDVRDEKLQDVRKYWKRSRFFFGKNKVMGMAMGYNRETEYKENLRKVTQHMHGQMGMLFTDQTKEQVLRFFNNFVQADYARWGNVASQSVWVDEGPLVGFSFSMEPQLRRLGMPTCLKRGTVTLQKNYRICEKDKTLMPDQAQLLKHFGHQMAEFRISITGMWAKDGTFEELTYGPPEVAKPPIVHIQRIAPEDIPAPAQHHQGDMEEEMSDSSAMDDEENKQPQQQQQQQQQQSDDKEDEAAHSSTMDEDHEPPLEGALAAEDAVVEVEDEPGEEET